MADCMVVVSPSCQSNGGRNSKIEVLVGSDVVLATVGMTSTMESIRGGTRQSESIAEELTQGQTRRELTRHHRARHG